MSQDSKQASTPPVNRPYQGDVIHVLRTTQQHHVMLGMIADQKANIILGAFLIFITVSQSMLETQHQLMAPVMLLSAFFTVSAIFALLVITPRFRNPKPASSDPTGEQAHNLLFFGYFSQMPQQEFITLINDTLTTNEEARLMIMKDIYQIGKVLNKKYSNLRYSYLSLGAGIIGSALWVTFLQLKSL